MTAVLEAVRDKPVALFQMDDTTPFQDYSGYNRSGTVTGTPATAVSLASGPTYSTVFSSAAIGKFTSPVFRQGQEDKPFALEVWAYQIIEGITSEVQILGNQGAFDGLTINGTVVSFVTKYASTGECRAAFDLQVNRRFHAVGIHTEAKNMLYIDGVLVAESEITEAQKVDSYISTDGFLYSGATTASTNLAVNCIGIYASSLSPESVARHFKIGNKHISREAVASVFGGVRIPLSQNESDVFLEQTWTTEFDWSSAFLTNVVVQDSKIKPMAALNAPSAEGVWLDVFPLAAAGVTSINGVNMLWDGQDAIIEASLDGTTWESVERGKNLSIIPPGFNPTNKILEIRISFAGGMVDDPAFVDNLTVTGFKTGVSAPVAGRVITYTQPAYVKNDHDPAELSDDWGVTLPAGGSLSIGPDSSTDPNVMRTVEVWVKSLTDQTTTFNVTAATTYQNGSIDNTSLVAGKWTLFHLILDADNAGALNIAGPAQIGQVVIYNRVLTAAEVSSAYRSYVGLPRFTAIDTSAIGVTEPALAAVIYDYDWSISAAG